MSSLAGKKFSARHTTVIPAAREALLEVANLPGVKRVALGVIKPGHTTPGVKIGVVMPGVLRVTVRGPASVQEVWIYLVAPEYQQAVEAILRAAFPK